MGAKGDFVWLIFETESKDPRNPANTYHSNSFEMIRIQNGKVQEHWDSAMKMPGSGNIKTGVSPKPPSQWNTGKLSKQEEMTLAMATEELKDMLQYGHLELADKTMDPGYIQHNPNVPQGRDGFKAFMSRVPGRTPQEIKPEWKNAPVLTLIDGPYSVMMWDRMAKDPDDPSEDVHLESLRRGSLGRRPHQGTLGRSANQSTSAGCEVAEEGNVDETLVDKEHVAGGWRGRFVVRAGSADDGGGD